MTRAKFEKCKAFQGNMYATVEHHKTMHMGRAVLEFEEEDIPLYLRYRTILQRLKHLKKDDPAFPKLTRTGFKVRVSTLHSPKHTGHP